MNPVRVWLDGIDVTSAVPRKDAGGSDLFPEWIETSVKGAGFFDLQVKPFEFSLLSDHAFTPTVGMRGASPSGCRFALPASSTRSATPTRRLRDWSANR